MKRLAPEHVQLLGACVSTRNLLRELIPLLPVGERTRELAARAAAVLTSGLKSSPDRLRYREVDTPSRHTRSGDNNRDAPQHERNGSESI